MDFEQIAQRLEWLDNERRKDKLVISTLEERLMKLEGDIRPVQQEMRDMEEEVNRIRSMLNRFEPIEASISKIRVDLTRMVEQVEKNQIERERDAEKNRLADIEALNQAIKTVRDGLDPIPSIKKDLKAREAEEHRLSRLIAEVDKKLLDIQRSDEEYIRAQKIMEENQRQSSKKVVDMQGEVSSVRKRVEEQRSKVDLVNETLKKLEMRQNELLSAEVDRKQSQTAFIDRHNLAQVERDRTWREWENRFELIDKQSLSLDEQLQSLDATQRQVKHAQEAFEDITQRFERRINEITEMQRLMEDRSRQEWVSFKADDQKRWSNYLLSSDESTREINRQFEKLESRLVLVEDQSQDMLDHISQILQELKRRYQAELTFARTLNEDFDDNFDVK
jgi:chromosome segregation ATPase